MKLNFKKTLALLLAIGMLLVILPTMAFAADDVCQIIDMNGVTIAGYDDFTDALAAIEDKQTIQLLTNIDYKTGMC